MPAIKFWKLLTDKDMTKTGLRMTSGLSSSTIARMARGGYIRASVLVRLCEVLGCGINEIFQTLPATQCATPDNSRESCAHVPNKKRKLRDRSTRQGTLWHRKTKLLPHCRSVVGMPRFPS
ncbi:MAG: helix-turn-helix domain-containing protein [Kiritimatiellia bacterium]